MRFGYKCPLILTAAAAAVIYTVTGFSFITGEEFEIPDFSRIAKLAEPAAAQEVTVSPEPAVVSAQAETVQTTVTEAADEEGADATEEAIPETELPEAEAEQPEETVAEAEQPDETVAEAVQPDEAETKAEQPDETVAEAAAEEPAETPDEAPAADPGEKPWEKGVVHTATDTVDADYFADALFIGDSRTVGLSQYCQELDEQAEFYAKISLTVKAALDKPFVKTEDGKKTVDEMLSGGRQFGKVYIMLGINEVAGGTDESFAADYSAMIDRIREKQPNAMIFIQSIMHVTKHKSDNDGHINNPRIDSRNAAIARLADAEKGIYYVDINQAVDDGEGNLIADLSFDEIHLKAVSYGLWYDFLKTHAHI